MNVFDLKGFAVAMLWGVVLTGITAVAGKLKLVFEK
jgi:hypothetical protein